MTVAVNEHTGDNIQTRNNTNAYRDNWDAIFKKSVIVEESPLNVIREMIDKAVNMENPINTVHHDPRAPYCPYCGVYELTLYNPHKLDCPKRQFGGH